MTTKGTWGEEPNSETNGMCAKYAIGTAAGLDMSGIRHRCTQKTCEEMTPAATLAVEAIGAKGDPIEKYAGNAKDPATSFTTRRKCTVSVRAAEDLRQSLLYPNASGQLATSGLAEVFSDLIAKALPKGWRDDPREAYKLLVVACHREMVMRHARNAFRANRTIILTRTAPHDAFRQGDAAGKWRHILVCNDRARMDAIKPSNIVLVMTTLDADKWDTLGMGVGYDTKYGMLSLGTFKTQKNRDMHQFGFHLPTLLWITGGQEGAPSGCPRVANSWQRTTEATLFG